MLGKGAEKIGYAMGRDIADSAKNVLKTNGDFHFLRGQVITVCITALMATLAYWLGSAGVFDFGEGRSFVRAFLRIPASGLAFICGLAYVYFWYFDHDRLISSHITYTIKFALQVLVLLVLLLHVLG
jgi:hypothetical protein